MNASNPPPEPRLRRLFLAALDITDPTERKRFLSEACGQDQALRQQLDQLLAQHKDDSFLEHPAVAAGDSTSEITVASNSAGAATPGRIQVNLPAEAKTLRYCGDYELLGEIARGGMGVVYCARQKSLNRVVAVKMILGGQLATDADVKRFHTEAEAAANLKHPNIVAIHEIGEHEGQHYFSMDLIEGQNLAQVIDSKPMAVPKAAGLLKTLAEAVHYAHQRGTLHRDLKPQNVLMDADGQPHITDFGLAKQMTAGSDLTQSGTVMGSPSYMPPEQAIGKQAEIGPASDVYSLGAILYQMLTGNAPFLGATAVDTLRQVIEQEPVAPSKLNEKVPSDLETICLKCLEKKSEQRYASARALVEELERFLNHEPILAKPASTVRKVVSWCRQRPWVLMGITTLAVLALLGLSYGLWERIQFLDWKANPSQTRIMWPELGKSSLLLSLLFIPFVLSLFFAATYKEIPRNGGWGFRFHVTLLALAGGLSVISGLFLTLFHIHLLVWQNHLAWTEIVPAFMTGPIPFTWAGATLLWHMASRNYGQHLGLKTLVPTPINRVQLDKVFWIVLVAETIVVNLLSYWVVTPGQYTPGLGTSPAEWDKFLRVWFVMTSVFSGMAPFVLAVGIRKRGNARWGCIFAAAVLLLALFHFTNSHAQISAAHPNQGERFRMAFVWGILTGVISGGSLIWVGLFRKK